MVHYEIGFKLQRDSLYVKLSARYPSAIMAFWCNYEKDVLEISYQGLEKSDGAQEEMMELTRALGGHPIRRAFAKSNVQLVTQHCCCINQSNRVQPVIERHNCLDVQPTVYSEGWEWRRVVAFSEKDIRDLFRDLDKFCNVEIVSRRTVEDGLLRDTFVLSTANLFGELTEKQTQALVSALESGYYRVPKRATTENVARRLGVPRTTFEEHLRKAESKVLLAIAPYAQFSSGGRRKGRLMAIRAIPQ